MDDSKMYRCGALQQQVTGTSLIIMGGEGKENEEKLFHLQLKGIYCLLQREAFEAVHDEALKTSAQDI